MRWASAIVEGSGRVGPEARAGSWPSGTSVTPRVIFVAPGAASWTKAAAFRGGEMAADYIDFFDGGAAGD